MLRFHTMLFARPSQNPANPPATFPVTFEQAQSHLMQLPRMDTEPDGYFLVAGGENEGQRWVVNGQLFELGDRLHRVEFHGACPAEIFDRLLRCFGWPEVEINFELVREGLTLEEASFREWAAHAG